MLYLLEIITSYSLWFLPICLVVGFFLSYLLYFFRFKQNDLSQRLKITLFLLRGFVLFFLFFLLLNPLLKKIINEEEKPILLVAIDNSQSVVFARDSNFVKEELVKRLRTMGDELSEKFEVKFYRFDSETKLTDSVFFNGKETDYSMLFREIDNNYSNRNVGALVFVSDGLYTKGSNPVYQSEKLKIPVYSIALGDTIPVKDNSIKKLDHNQVTYLGNKFPLEVICSSSKLKGSKVSISITKAGKKLAEQTCTFSSDNEIRTLSFMLDADQAGTQTYTVFMSRTDGEFNYENNIQRFVIDVIDNREKILLLGAAPHPDLGAIKESIELSNNYEVETELLTNFNKPLKPYSLVIFHGVSTLTGSKFFNELNNSNAPYLLIAPTFLENVPGLNFNGPQGKLNDAEPSINRNFSLFTLSDDFKSFANEFPALKCNLGTYILNAGAQVLFEQNIGTVSTANPLIYFTQKGEQKIGVVLAEGLWSWKMREYAEKENHQVFNELITKCIQYLSVKADKSFFRVYAKKIYKENEVVELDAEVYNESYELITEPEVNLVLNTSEGKKFDYTFSKTETAYKLNLGLLSPGDYTYLANVKVKDKIFQKAGGFTVSELIMEKSNLVADHYLLRQLSVASNGKFYHSNKIDDVKKDLLNNEEMKSITYSQKELTDLIDEKIIFFCLLLLITVEWVLRKRNGLL